MKKIIPLGLAAIFMALSIMLMVLLKGVVMRFSSGPQMFSYESYSYIDAMVFGASGNWLPLISFILSIASLVFIVISILQYAKSKSPKSTSIVCTMISIFASLLSFLIFDSMNAVSILIVAAMSISMIIQYIGYTKIQVK